MRPRLAVWLFGMIVLLLPGCLSGYIAKNVFVDPMKYDYHIDNLFRCVRDKKWAELAWQRVEETTPYPLSKHYRRGSEEGFHDYLNNGGNGEPPLSPPRRYWALFYQSPEGSEAIQDWFAGFRHGAAVARESGYRDLIIIPTYMPAKDPTDSMRNANKTTDKNGAPVVHPSEPNSTTELKTPDNATPPKQVEPKKNELEKPKDLTPPKLEKPKAEGHSDMPKRPVDQPEPPKKPAPLMEESPSILPTMHKHGESD